jgi:hypothetical protein
MNSRIGPESKPRSISTASDPSASRGWEVSNERATSGADLLCPHAARVRLSLTKRRALSRRFRRVHGRDAGDGHHARAGHGLDYPRSAHLLGVGSYAKTMSAADQGEHETHRAAFLGTPRIYETGYATSDMPWRPRRRPSSMGGNRVASPVPENGAIAPSPQEALKGRR